MNVYKTNIILYVSTERISFVIKAVEICLNILIKTIEECYGLSQK